MILNPFYALKFYDESFWNWDPRNLVNTVADPAAG